MAYDRFQWWNPADWFGAHSETSMWKSDRENQRIRDREARERMDRLTDDSGYRGSERAFEDSIDDYREAVDELREEQRDRERKSRRASERFEREARRQRKKDEKYWVKQRGIAEKRLSQALSGWQTDRGRIEAAFYDPKYAQVYKDTQGILRGTLRDWQSRYDKDLLALTDIRDQQLALAREIREAPSTIAEQARIEADRALSQNAAMAGAFGGSLASNYGALASRAMTAQGDVLTKTSALRAAEHADRINQQAAIIGQAGGTTTALANLGLTNVNVGKGVAGDLYKIMGAERGAETGLLSGLGTYEAGLMRSLAQDRANLGLKQVNVGTALTARENQIFQNLQSSLNFGLSGNIAGIQAARAIPQMQASLLQAQYNKMMSDRNFQASLAAGQVGGQAGGGGSGILSGLLGIGGSILGGVIGGPAGATIGGALGGGVGSLMSGGSGTGFSGGLGVGQVISPLFGGGAGSGGSSGDILGGLSVGDILGGRTSPSSGFDYSRFPMTRFGY